MSKYGIVNAYPKGITKSLSENFSVHEFDCSCTSERCHYTLIHDTVIRRLQQLRNALGVSLHLTSAFRCMMHNMAVGGSKTSKHTLGFAVDIACPKGIDFDVFAKACKTAFGFTIEYKDKNFVHCDIRNILLIK